MRGTNEMDYVWCPLREEALFNFTDEQLVKARSQRSFQKEAEKAGAANTFCIDGREAAEKNPTRYINAARTPESLGSACAACCENAACISLLRQRKPRQCKKVNTQICEFGDVAYFRLRVDSFLEATHVASHVSLSRTTKDIKRGAELVTDYGSEYWEDREGLTGFMT
eukprot:Skav200708  [mRNA]  locus=scaffold2650:62380:63053:- [translate_table: standard]